MNTKKLVLCGLMSALVCIATMIIQVPVPGTNGYVNIGDSMIFVTSILFGPIPGMICGGIGSFLADIFSGYAHWALYSLIIKGLEGFVVGVLISKGYSLLKSILATVLGGIVMVIGYLFAGAILYGSLAASITSVPSNLMQAFFSILIAVPISYLFVQNKFIKNLLK